MPVKLENIVRGLRDGLTEPLPTRILIVRALDTIFGFLSYEAKLNFRTLTRVPYGFGLLHAARQAKRLGVESISALEFGVAGGNGLAALEEHAGNVKRETGVDIAIYGFDTAAGLPPPEDYRDMPYAWGQGFFPMDRTKLERRLKRAKLVIGDVRDTARQFAKLAAPPIGFISFDLDYYSSTIGAFEIFKLQRASLMPRVICYFDDVAGGIGIMYNEFTGELLAIQEFNQANQSMKIARVAGLRHSYKMLPALWQEQIYVAHLFDHPRYNDLATGMRASDLALK